MKKIYTGYYHYNEPSFDRVYANAKRFVQLSLNAHIEAANQVCWPPNDYRQPILRGHPHAYRQQ